MENNFVSGDDVEFDSAELDATVRGTIQEFRSDDDDYEEAQVHCVESIDGTQRYDHFEWVPVAHLRRV